MALSARLQQFVREYLVDLNATHAAIRTGYSARVANRNGPRLLRNPEVAAAVAMAIRERAARMEITQDMVIAELAKIAFGDARRVMVWGPDGVVLRDSAALTDEEAAIVAEAAETKTEGGGSLRLKTHDKVGALKLLGEHLGMFTKNTNLRFPDGAPLVKVYPPGSTPE